MMETFLKITKRYSMLLGIYGMLLLVFLTSCPIKSSVKNLLGIPTTTEQSTSRGSQVFAVSISEKCAVAATSEAHILQNNAINMNDLLPLLFFATAFLFMYRLFPLPKESKHPVYNRSAKISNSIPLFLAYRKLILHFA